MRRAAAVGVAVAVAVLLVGVAGSGAVGTDQRAAEAAAESAPDYDRWATPAWTPSAWGESVLFALQAGVGGAVLAYYLRRLRTEGEPTREA